MQIIILSGGSGSRLWPLSNDARSKQFLKVLPIEGSEEKESMIQRMVRQLHSSEIGKNVDITIATSVSQRDAVISQLPSDISVITEPERRKTFPSICLACEYLSLVKKISDEETVLVMPCDTFTEPSYFKALGNMVKGIQQNDFKMMVMGVKPTYPSSKYGYLMPAEKDSRKDFVAVEKFIEKPSAAKAEKLISEGAFWNGGVFCFKLKYGLGLSETYLNFSDFEDYKLHYSSYPEISFDKEVAEKAKSVGMVFFNGYWKDLGTWNTLTDEMGISRYGNVITDDTTSGTHIFNELNLPLLCLGTTDLIIAASPDGIIVSEKSKSEKVKQFMDELKNRPMYEERRWGTYKVIDYVEFPDNFHALTKQLTLNPGGSISYQRHSCRDEVWTFIDGEGELVIEDERRNVKRGDVINIPKGTRHALRAKTSLTFIEVQHGSRLIEEDIERFPFDW